jgi:predicted patatin/cPLA2 family phospholipase
MSLDYVGKVWRGEIGKKRMNIERVRESKTDLLIAVTDYETGSGELLRVNDLEDPVCPIVASCSIPLLTETKVLCGKKYYTDGAMSLAFPIKDVIKKVNPTSMLIFPNRDKKYADNIWVRIWESIMYYSKDGKSAKKFIEKQKIYDKELAYLRRQNIPYIIIWTDKQVSSFTMDKKKLKLGYKRYKKYVQDLFQKHL